MRAQATKFNIAGLNYRERFEYWQAFYFKVRNIAERIRAAKLERANKIWREAFGSDRPPANCVHNWILNAESGTSDWTRYQLRQAKLVNALINDWTASNAADNAQSKVWKRLGL